MTAFRGARAAPERSWVAAPARAAATAPATGGRRPRRSRRGAGPVLRCHVARRPTGDFAAAGPTDPGEDAYIGGFRLWQAASMTRRSRRCGRSPRPIRSIAASATPAISSAAALLDKGQARAAAEALLANYRSNPQGERAPDSLFYLGQSLIKLGQPGQACKAYDELDSVYGAKVRPDLKKMIATPSRRRSAADVLGRLRAWLPILHSIDCFRPISTRSSGRTSVSASRYRAGPTASRCCCSRQLRAPAGSTRRRSITACAPRAAPRPRWSRRSVAGSASARHPDRRLGRKAAIGDQARARASATTCSRWAAERGATRSPPRTMPTTRPRP